MPGLVASIPRCFQVAPLPPLSLLGIAVGSRNTCYTATPITSHFSSNLTFKSQRSIETTPTMATLSIVAGVQEYIQVSIRASVLSVSVGANSAVSGHGGQDLWHESAPSGRRNNRRPSEHVRHEAESLSSLFNQHLYYVVPVVELHCCGDLLLFFAWI